MANKVDLIDFDIIEDQKENIQSLPNGRSAKSLAQIFSPAITSAPSHTQNLNDAIRAEYEKELTTIDDSDDPLDIYDRYVRWTLNAYPSAQATPASQLLSLLERATKTFLKDHHYKDDSRYLKLWLYYVRFFSDAPRETFAYLARHGIGNGLALFYEEFAAWLEGAGRWNQAEEIYRMGMQRGARPAERLARKFTQFEKRAEARTQNGPEPNSPALPTVRAALAAKVDPFSAVSPPPADPQAAQVASRNTAAAGARRQKMQIFSDEGAEEQAVAAPSTNGWESIGSIADRKKENVVIARAWNGETLSKGTRQNLGVPKMPIFKDELSDLSSLRDQQSINPRTGRVERVFACLEAVYPNPADPQDEYCFEELRASARGWLQRDWAVEKKMAAPILSRPSLVPSTTTTLLPLVVNNGKKQMPQQLPRSLVILNDENDENAPPGALQQHDLDVARRTRRREEKANRTQRIRIREETQTIQTNLSSPKGPKLKRKKIAEPTMTMHAKIATDEVYELFNQPLKTEQGLEEEAEGEESESESDDEQDDDDDYTSSGESTGTGTGHISGATSEYEDDTRGDLTNAKLSTDGEDETRDASALSEDTTEKFGSGLTYVEEQEPADEADEPLVEEDELPRDSVDAQAEIVGQEFITLISPDAFVPRSEKIHIPIAPDDYEAPTKPYRSAAQAAHNRMPFMTPIVEKTESSLGALTTRQEKDYFNSKTPCPKASQKTPIIQEMDDEPWSSPFQEVMNETLREPPKLPQPVLTKAKPKVLAPVAVKQASRDAKELAKKGPIIQEAQCNPMEDSVHKAILDAIQPPLSTFEGYFDHSTSNYNRKSEIKKFCKSVASKSGRSGVDKTSSTLMVPPILRFQGTDRQYAVKRELGAGAYAPVYLLENFDTAPNEGDVNETPSVLGQGRFSLTRQTLEALKMEDPLSPWEFYIIRTAHRRLGVSRAAESIVHAYEMHLFKDEGYLIEEYRDQGTLLDLVNAMVQQNGGPAMDEPLAMFFTIELLRTVEALHAKGIIHGDLKADNILVRFPTVSDTSISSTNDDTVSPNYCPDGSNGWCTKGITLIDFGRGIDMRAFLPSVQFIADWPTSATDCTEMRELRPWTFQADYHGVAAIAHTMLFGRYIETVVEKGAGAGVAAGKAYRLKEGLKRYWQGEIWGGLFALMLNPVRAVDGEEGGRLPCVRGMKGVREKMEAWLVANGEKGVGLRALVRRVEMVAGAKRKA